MATATETMEREEIFKGPYAASEVFGRAPDVPVYLAKFKTSALPEAYQIYVAAFDHPRDKDGLAKALSEDWGFPVSRSETILEQWDLYTRRKVPSPLFTRKSWREALTSLDDRHIILPDLLKNDQGRLEEELKRLIHLYDPKVNPQISNEDVALLLRRRTPESTSFIHKLRRFLEAEDPRFIVKINANLRARRDRKLTRLPQNATESGITEHRAESKRIMGEIINQIAMRRFRRSLTSEGRQELFDHFFDSENPARTERLEHYYDARYNWQRAVVNPEGDQIFIDRTRYGASLTLSPNSGEGLLFMNIGKRYKVTGDVRIIPQIQNGSVTKRADFDLVGVASAEKVFPVLAWQNDSGEQRTITTDFFNYTLSSVLAKQFGVRLPQGLAYNARSFDTLLGAVDFANSSHAIPRDGELHTHGSPSIVPMYVHSHLKELSSDERLEQAEKFMAGANIT